MKTQQGQSIVVLLIFVLVAMTITTFAIFVIAANSLTIAKFQGGVAARELADTGAENALISLLRDDQYTGETFPVGADTVQITVSGEATKTIISTGKSGEFIRVVEVMTSYVDNRLTVTSWKEVY